jgi:predicted RNA binding protein YcfA (HicA-like mRNA interferase family)
MKLRDAIRLVEIDGWELVREVRGQRQLRHPTRPGTVTVAGKLGVAV